MVMHFPQAIHNVRKLSVRNWLLIAFFILAGLLLVALIYRYIPTGGDWTRNLRSGALALLSGKNPYDGNFYNAPWSLIPILPLAVLPERVGGAILFLAGLVGYFVLLRKLNANIFTTLIFIFSPPVLENLRLGNIEWLVMLGYLMPPQIGLFFVLMKPQVGFAMAIYWLVEAWRNGGVRQVLKIFLPVTIATLLSLVIFGLWPLKMSRAIDVFWNLSLWPLSIPIGLVLLTLAIRRRKASFAYMASPFLSPYVTLYSYGTVILGLVSSTWETLAAVGGLWIAMLVQYLSA
ncbi:MAG: hypothetical protein ACM3H7_01950 [Acidobacteriaceae bacterium]